MGNVSLLTRTRLAALATSLLAGGVLLAQAAPAVAAPSPTTPASTSVSSTDSTAPSGTGSTSTSTSAGHAPRPAATAPSTGNPGPACTTNADKLYPVICLPKGAGEDRPGQVTPGADIEFDAQVVNNGNAVADADVVITLPEGLQLESDEDNPVYRYDDWYNDDSDEDPTGLDCTAGSTTITCHVGKLDHFANVLIGIDLVPDEDTAPGTNLKFQVALQPVLPDTYPSTAVEASLDVTAPAHLVVTLTPATERVVVGHSATITAQIHNDGPGTAADTFAFALDVDQNDPRHTHFVVTSGSDASGALKSIGAIPARGTTLVRERLQRQALAHAAKTVSRHALPSVRFWPVGNLASGATARIPVVVKATSEGEDSLLFAAQSQTGDTPCDDDEGGGSASESAGPTGPPSATTSTSSSAVPLANSGTHGLDAQLGIAVWAVVLGAGLVWLGRRRVAGGRHQG